MLGITFSSKIVEGKSLHEIPVHSSLTQDSSSSSGPLLGGKAQYNTCTGSFIDSSTICFISSTTTAASRVETAACSALESSKNEVL